MASRKAEHAVVTPYFKEDPFTLARCMQSVHHQTVKADHILVADGHPQSWINDFPVRHISLDECQADYGGTPRCVGSMLAASGGYASISFLDADNWYDEGHVEKCWKKSKEIPNCDLVVAKQRIVKKDGKTLHISLEEIERHVDTNCYFLLPGAYHCLSIWALMPKEATSVGDRFFFHAIQNMDINTAVMNEITVNYQTMWEIDYKKAGENAPDGAKPSIDVTKIANWRKSLNNRDKEILKRLMRVDL